MQGCNLLLGPAGSNLLSNLNADALGVDSSSHKPFSVQGCAAKAFHNASWQQGLTGQRRRQVTGQGMHQFMLTQVAAQVGQIGIPSRQPGHLPDSKGTLAHLTEKKARPRSGEMRDSTSRRTISGSRSPALANSWSAEGMVAENSSVCPPQADLCQQPCCI